MVEKLYEVCEKKKQYVIHQQFYSVEPKVEFIPKIYLYCLSVF